MEEKKYNYLFDDRELDGLDKIDELSDEELDNLLTKKEKEELEKELEETDKDFKVEYEN